MIGYYIEAILYSAFGFGPLPLGRESPVVTRAECSDAGILMANIPLTSTPPARPPRARVYS